jgi:hypothetical protein
MHFPLPNNVNMFHSDTLIDGEVNLVENTGGVTTVNVVDGSLYRV